MREYGGDIRFARLEAQTWAMKQSSFNVFHNAIKPQTLFSNI